MAGLQMVSCPHAAPFVPTAAFVASRPVRVILMDPDHFRGRVSRARSHGAYVHPNVSVGTFALSSMPGAPPGTPDTKVRGLLAKGFIKEGNVLFAIPDNLTLHVEKLGQHHLLAPVYQEVPQLHDGWVVARGAGQENTRMAKRILNPDPSPRGYLTLTLA